jgi:cysteine dioxygenase
MRSLDQFVEGLRRIAPPDFTLARVAEYLAADRIDPATVAPYRHFTPTHYTRNLIHRTELFELMAICWDVGQVSRIHNHQGQNCWMAVPEGRLVVQNYEVLHQEPGTGSCALRETNRVVMDPDHPAWVDPEQPVHAVINPTEHGARAVSLHVYSRPYDRCLVYSRENNSYLEVPLFFDTEYGKPTTG